MADRFVWDVPGAVSGDTLLACAQRVCLYDGEEQTAFDNGTLELYATKIIWIDAQDKNCRLRLDLALVLAFEKSGRSLTKSPRITLHLAPVSVTQQAQGPMSVSNFGFIRWMFRQGGDEQFYAKLVQAMDEKAWLKVCSPLPGTAPTKQRGGAGIAGIERRMQQEFRSTSGNIQQAFEDLSKLIDTAKDMVSLSKSISDKIRSKQGDVTEDETIQFKTYLLSLGIHDPVTKETHGTGDQYYKGLAKEIARVLEKPLRDAGGMMTLTDAYCRLNRARGLELVSPEDVVNACKLLHLLELPVRLHTFDSGVMVVTLAESTIGETVSKTVATVMEHESISADELAGLVGISVILAKERLLSSENAGKLCRDETVQGLRFFPNYFLEDRPP